VNAGAAVTENYVDSYYSRTIAGDRPRPALDGPVETEVCVIGGGMAGLATALGRIFLSRFGTTLNRSPTPPRAPLL
jgi:hypothetical protein